MEYTYCYQKYKDLWELIIATYTIAIIVCIFWQAGHVTRMKIKTLALEGDTSIRLLLLVVVVAVCHIFVKVILVLGGNIYAALIVDVLGSMTFPMMTIVMIFSQKV